MADVLFIEYPKCSTCKKAKAWLDAHGVAYADRHIVEDNRRPTSWPLGMRKADCRCAVSSTPAACCTASAT